MQNLAARGRSLMARVTAALRQMLGAAIGGCAGPEECRNNAWV